MSGLIWENIGYKKPEKYKKIVNKGLSELLKKKNIITIEEKNKLDINDYDIVEKSYIKVNNSYYKPVNIHHISDVKNVKNIIILDEAGADYAIANLSALGLQGIGTLTQHAGNAVANGLDWDKAFAAITSTPASWFNLSLINNSLVIWDGDPLNVTSTPTSMFINGQEQSLESRQTLLRDRYNPVNETEKAYKYR